MQYMLLVYGEDRLWQELPRDEAVRLEDARNRWAQELVMSGQLRTMTGLHPASTATTIRRRNDVLEIIDGPSTGREESLGGCHMVECRNLDEAIAIASRFPALGAGFSMEVRPVMPR